MQLRQLPIIHRSSFRLHRFRCMLPAVMIIALALLGGVLSVVLGLLAAWSRHKKSARGVLDLTGRVGSVAEALRPEGAVLVDGELWRARVRSGRSVERGRVRVVGGRGHLLEVEAES
jgi:membrane-bound ClpP family serine protease